MAPKRKASNTVGSKSSARKVTKVAPAKLKLVLTSSSSGTSSKTAFENVSVLASSSDEEELGLSSGLDDEDEDDLVLESSPVRASPPKKLSFRLPKLSLSLSKSSSSTRPTDLEEEEEDEMDDLEGDDSQEEVLQMRYCPDYLMIFDVFDSPKKMTARQRAVMEAASTEMYNDTVPTTTTKAASAPILSEEELLKKAEKTRRRQLMRDQKLEESKQATIQRLLQKQGARSKRMQHQNDSTDGLANANETKQGPGDCEEFHGIRYTDSKAEGPLLLVTEPTQFEAIFGSSRPTINKPGCSVAWCGKEQKYWHPKGHMPVCSLACYRKI